MYLVYIYCISMGHVMIFVTVGTRVILKINVNKTKYVFCDISINNNSYKIIKKYTYL